MSTGVIGEYFVLCELMRRDFVCLTPPDPGNQGWDIVAYDSDTNVGVTLQVKTVRWPSEGSETKAVLTGKFGAAYDFLVVVVVEFPCAVDYLVYVVPKSNIIGATGNEKGAVPSERCEKFRFKGETIPFSTFRKKKGYLDVTYGGGWDQVERLLKSRSKSGPIFASNSHARERHTPV